MKSQAFVTGATGFTGREVVRVLLERRVPVTAHVRPDSHRLDEWQKRFEEMGARVDTSAWTREAMTATLKDLAPTHVFALLGTIQARMKQAAREGRDPESESYEAVDYGLTMALLHAARECASKPRFIYLSAAGVKPGSRNAYYKARARAEQALFESGLPYCVARPSFIIGPDRDVRRPMEKIGAVVSDGLLRAAGLFGARRFQERYASTTNTALAHALAGMALDPKAENRIFESEDLHGGQG